MDNEAAIKIKNLSFTYPRGEKPAIDNINLEVKKGEFLVIMGPNGAGKTTLCLPLNGVIPTVINGEYNGKVIVEGMVTTEHMVYELAQKVGVTLQDPESQLFCPTVKSEIVFGPENLGVPREEILSRLANALKVTRLEGREENSPLQLSGGQKQRCALAAAIAIRPEILVLDEPTSQLDPVGTSEVFSVVSELNKKYGVTVIMAEHKSEEIAEFADRVLVLHEGKIVAEGDPHEVFVQHELLNKIYVKIPQVSQFASRLSTRVKFDPFPVTIDEAYRQIYEFLTKGLVSVKPCPISTVRKNKSDEVVLETKNLWYMYPPDIMALKDVSIKIYDGEFVGIIGQNGAGKTTLVKHFVGLLKPTKGEVFVVGKNTKEARASELSRNVGLVLQNPDHQLFATTAREEVEFGPRNLGLSEDEVKQRVEEALHLVGLKKYEDLFPFRLSFGDRKKLTVAAIYSMKPKILILDEPTTGQDYKGRYEILEIAKSLHEKGHTIIMITHDMELVAKYAERTIVLGMGEVLLDGPTMKVFSESEILKKTYLKPPQIVQLAQSLSERGFPSLALSVEEICELIELKGE
ncbi:ATP-binding cassette domain-containing protein [Candidatus Bathyarchaeota archaeon]|nr:ATP-binding cassette domain-containing protein [Candidatus Bathyarchaeota archaeon]